MSFHLATHRSAGGDHFPTLLETASLSLAVMALPGFFIRSWLYKIATAFLVAIGLIGAVLNYPREHRLTDAPASSPLPYPYKLVSSTDGLANSENPIDHLVEKLQGELLWENGPYPIIKLPSTAQPNDVLNLVSSTNGPDNYGLAPHEVLETRRFIGPFFAGGTAVLIKTDHGKKIVLMRAQGKNSWWTRVYEIEP